MPRHIVSKIHWLAKRIALNRGHFVLFLIIVAVGFLGLWPQINLQSSSGVEPGLAGNFITNRLVASDIRNDLAKLNGEIRQLEDDQAKYGVSVVDDSTIQQELSSIQIDLSGFDYKLARQDIVKLKVNYQGWRKQLDDKISQQMADLAHGPQVTAPILIYHYPPPDFEKQLQYLQAHGYTSIDLDQLAAALMGHGGLPPKPVVITFDDGFSPQMHAFELLKKYNMKATFYIIDGGDRSGWCLGAGRRYDQPKGCGDPYMNWDQIRELDHSGLITIASHTVDHLNLASQPEDVQRFEIFQGKAILEQQLGHPVRHFAYPYGSYNATTINLVREAGFMTAVSTLPGTVHSGNDILTLHRVRDPYKLP